MSSLFVRDDNKYVKALEALVHKNTLAADYTNTESVLWSRNSEGVYIGTTDNAVFLDGGHTYCQVTIGGNDGSTLFANFARSSDTEVTLRTFDAAGNGIDIASGTTKEVSVLIEVFPD